jgi:hypothetical protein
MRRGWSTKAFIGRILLSACLVLALTSIASPAFALEPAQGESPQAAEPTAQLMPTGQRIVLSDVPSNLFPQNKNIWQCACDNDGCWPGCFTVASASVLQYWSQHGYPQLWNGDENGTLQRLRDLFPNLFCYNNVDDDGQPSDSGYDATDVAKGFKLFVQERGYNFSVQPVYKPTFEQVVKEIDAGRPIIGAFGVSPWGSHAGTIIGYDTTNGRQIMIVRPNLLNKPDTELTWGVGYGEFGIVTVSPKAGETEEAINPNLNLQVLVNDNDPSFSMVGNWVFFTVGHDEGSHFAATTDPSNLGPREPTAIAKWAPMLPADGIWEVQTWIPREDDNDMSAMIATYQINHAEGMNLIRRSQHTAKPGWMPLGAYPLMRGDKGNVQLGNLTGDVPPRRVYADAMKFVWLGPLVVQSEETGAMFMIVDGQRRQIPDQPTFDALKLRPIDVRKVTQMVIDAYPAGEMLPSVMSQWVGVYYNNTQLSAPHAAIRADNALSLRWNGAAPAVGVEARGFSARWTRYMALAEGEYPFRLEAVGGVRLWVDGQLALNEWESRDGIFTRHDVPVKVKGGIHRVEIELVNRDGLSQISLGNLPPNMPVIASVDVGWTQATTATLRWQDAGDADQRGDDNPRRFFVSVWSEATGWRNTSGWITDTTWMANLPGDGQYQWSVVASDGLANSEATPPRPILVDRSAPWAQMVDATTAISAAMVMTASSPIDAYKLVTDVNGNLVVQAVQPAEIAPGGVPVDQLQPRAELQNVPQTGNLPAIIVRWFGKDAPAGNGDGLHYDVQVRELVRAHTTYTFTVQTQEVARIGYSLVISGSEEITVPVEITETVAVTGVAPVVNYEPLASSEWITFATGLRMTETLFLGNPGSTYEFRVRAVDAAGNQQDWHDGYSVQAAIDPKTILFRNYLPNLLKP